VLKVVLIPLLRETMKEKTNTKRMNEAKESLAEIMEKVRRFVPKENLKSVETAGKWQSTNVKTNSTAQAAAETVPQNN